MLQSRRTSCFVVGSSKTQAHHESPQCKNRGVCGLESANWVTKKPKPTRVRSEFTSKISRKPRLPRDSSLAMPHLAIVCVTPTWQLLNTTRSRTIPPQMPKLCPATPWRTSASPSCITSWLSFNNFAMRTRDSNSSSSRLLHPLSACAVSVSSSMWTIVITS